MPARLALPYGRASDPNKKGGSAFSLTESGRASLLKPRGCAFFRNLLRRERRATAAASRRVRIREGETGTHDVGDVINLDTIQILRAEHVDEQADAFFIQDKIALT